MKIFENFLIFILILTFVSCVSNSQKPIVEPQGNFTQNEEQLVWNNDNETPKIKEKTVPSVAITAQPTKNKAQLVGFFVTKNPNANLAKIELMAELYILECELEGINSDVAFVQMCLETGYLRFGGLVTEEMNNFCGLGAIDKDNPGNSFKTVKDGIIAHVQHLKAYGSEEPLVGALVDPRYKWVNPKGKAPTIFELSGTWAADKEYGQKLYNLLMQLSEF